jgi:hypothetical protein
VRRRLPNRLDLGPLRAQLPIRILLVSPRPEDGTAGYIDHRVSARAPVEAVTDLGDLADLGLLDPPTFPALRQALATARDKGEPIDVVHFDGHGVFDPEHGLGALCFEDPEDEDKPRGRAAALVHADQLAATLRDQRIPLVFLEACRSAKSDQAPTASVAARLLQEGCSAVVAMGYSVLVETARRFTEAFYGGLARGRRVGEAFLRGQAACTIGPTGWRSWARADWSCGTGSSRCSTRRCRTRRCSPGCPRARRLHQALGPRIRPLLTQPQGLLDMGNRPCRRPPGPLARRLRRHPHPVLAPPSRRHARDPEPGPGKPPQRQLGQLGQSPLPPPPLAPLQPRRLALAGLARPDPGRQRLGDLSHGLLPTPRNSDSVHRQPPKHLVSPEAYPSPRSRSRGCSRPYGRRTSAHVRARNQTESTSIPTPAHRTRTSRAGSLVHWA